MISKGIGGCNHTTKGQGCPETKWSGVIRYIYTTTTVAILAMWRTQFGDRILEGAQAKVFAEALLNLLDEEAQAGIKELRKLCNSIIEAS